VLEGNASVIRRLVFAALVSGSLLTGGVSVASAATPVALVLPQATAFSVLGASCGGIQETVYATGFDAATGYPTGIVQMSTRCGGSGRGGGYKTTTYTASAGVTWDFTTAVVSWVSPAPAVAVNPTLSVFDGRGNRLYNQAGQAWLLLAAGFVPVARVTSVAPATGPTAGGTKVTISGTGFTGATRVNFGTVAATSLTVTSSTSLTAISPIAAAGIVDVTIVNPGGTSVAGAGDRFTFVAPPVVAAVTPNSGSAAGGTGVTISGTNLAAVTRITFGGTAAGFTVNSDTSITATSPGAQAAGTVDIRLTSIGGTSARTNADRFTYVAARPVITAISPDSGSVAGGSEVTITGTSLSGVTEVDFGAVAASFWINDDTSITAFSPAASAGTVHVTAVSYGLRSTTGAADQFTSVADPAAIVTGVSPAAGPVDGGVIISITGTGFTNAIEVDFGGVAAPFAVNDDTSMIALVPAGAAGVVDVTVVTGSGPSAASPADQFTYVAAPAVTSISPATGTVDGGTEVTISGTDLGGAVEVDFGGVAAGFTVNADGSITAIAPPGTAGVVDVTVMTAGGTSTSSPADEFTYL
jgi:hypothetical protein